MAITIADIAREANVSISTVSRVINNTKPVSPQLRERVYEVIERNHFKPNVLAQGLITRKTNVIGVIVPDISNAVFGALTKGINSICTDKGYTLMVCESGGRLEHEMRLLKVLEDRMADGVLFAGVDVNHVLVSEMEGRSYPVVLVTQEASEGQGTIPTVVHDNVRALYDAVNFLIDNGHRRIAYIGGPRHDFSSGKKRLKGYCMALEEAGIECRDSYIEQGAFSYDAGYQGMRRIYEENSVLPTAVVTGSDVIALGAIQFIKNAGLDVPGDISILGFDDLDFATYFKPELSTVRISYFDEGMMAAQELIRQIEGGERDGRTVCVPHKIIRRNTIRNIGRQ